MNAMKIKNSLIVSCILFFANLLQSGKSHSPIYDNIYSKERAALTHLSIRKRFSFAFANPFDIIKRDFQALTRRVTAYHILLPKSDDVALLLKQKIRNKAYPDARTLSTVKNIDYDESEKSIFILDAFSRCAKKNSRDKETAERGGLLGKLVPQGYCLVSELDRACFEVPLGQVSGPIESDYGYHLLLVVERTNCPKLDGDFTRIERGGPNGADTIFAGPKGGIEEVSDAADFVLQQAATWIAVIFAGIIVAELAASI